MKLKTVREELLFAAHDYHQRANAALEMSGTYLNQKGHKGTVARLLKDFRVYARRARAMDEALKLL